jgi:integrase
MGKKPQGYPTKHPGVYYILSTRYPDKGDMNRVYYLRYQKDGKQVDEKLGRHGERGNNSDERPWPGDLTLAKARDARTAKTLGKYPTKAELRARKKAAEAAEAKRMTMTKLWERFKVAKAANKSFRDDEVRWKKHLEHRIGSLLVEEVTHEAIQSVMNGLAFVKNERTGKSIAPGTRHHILMLIKRMLNFADSNDLGRVNGKARKFKLPKLNNRVTEALDEDQAKALLEAIDLKNVEKEKDYIPALMMQLAWCMGLRKGEIMKLQWDHLKGPKKDFLRLVDPKGGEDVELPILDGAPEIFEQARQVAEEQGVKDSPYIFPATRGRLKGKMRSDVTTNAKRLRDAAGLPQGWRPFHGIRHCFGTRLANMDGISFDQVKELMTHKNSSTTERYVSNKDKMKLRAAKTINEQNKKAAEQDEAPDNSREGAA